MEFTVVSTTFEYGTRIPADHTCDGDDESPPIRWEGEPEETVSFALIMEDPDAPGGTFTHWIVYNLPADCHQLEQNIPIEKDLDNGAIQGRNDFGRIGYMGPCPPAAKEHHYWLRIFALRKELPPGSADNGKKFYEALMGLVLDRAEHMGTYSKKSG
jgi:Raf kinase inhibitor-like YbhB/YbcL family protein